MGRLMRLGMTLGLVGTGLGATTVAVEGQTAPTGPIKIGYIRSQEVLAAAPGRATADSAYGREVEAANVTERAWQDSITTMLQDYAKSESTLAAADRDARQRTIRDKQAEYQRRDQELRARVQQRQTELIQPIMDEVNKVLNDVRADDNYTIIFDVQAQGGGIVAVDRNLDITDRVIARLRTVSPPPLAKAGSAPTKPATGPVQAPAGITQHPRSQ
jgi:outer membrane protein